MTMTTKTKMIAPFSRAPEEDVSKWVANIKFLMEPFNFSETEALRTVCINLRGGTFDWARVKLKREPTTTATLLLHDLEGRFLSKLHLSNVVRRFLSDSIPLSVEEYFGMLKDAAYFENIGYMSLDALVDRIITRSPPEVRITLWQFSGAINSIFDLSKLVERIIPSSFNTMTSKPLNQHSQAEFTSAAFPVYHHQRRRQPRWLLREAGASTIRNARTPQRSAGFSRGGGQYRWIRAIDNTRLIL
ncbi:hypothetical protein PAEPH01_2213 [Pancytospora epiphaga]|nr:hypothetical protein PAEPH01_2213 [Pancytospora epiphaga]